ncbi:MAG: Maf family nucleotide pyrophosphatase [Candidatus Omnitrophota bacterium]|jgi:MAF protein
MMKLYLASDSKARKKLLKIFGLKFRVISSGIQEKGHSCGLSYGSLVKHNALQKARAVAENVPGGVIVGADTLVVQGKRIFGKPKDLAGARVMLKQLSGKAQWIYTGLAVINKDTHKQKVAFEKTKIYMDTLTDAQINTYFASVSPLDKAGSFDIQGKGAFFIRRIEGCFYNVVGVPLRKLYRMFKAVGVNLFLFILILLPAAFGLLCGCSTEYNIVTGQQETYYYSTDKEVQMGASLSKELEKEYKLVDDPLVQERVSVLGKRIAAVCDRKDIDYRFKVVNEDEVNAISLPGGYVYVFKGLLDKVSGDAELAAVLAHEVGHIVARHSIKKLQGVMSYDFLRLLVAAVPGSAPLGAAADVAFMQLFLGYSREDELLADQLGARYIKRAGFDPHSMITFLKKLQENNQRKELAPINYFKTHPYVPDRVRVVKQELGETIDFTDYINIQDKKHK